MFRGRAGGEVSLGVDVWGCPSQHRRCEEREVRLLPEVEVRLRVQTLEQMVSEKLRCTMMRCRSADFADLWLAFTSTPDLSGRVVRELTRREDIFFDPPSALQVLEGLASSWSESLRDSMVRSPAWAEVWRDLNIFLPPLKKE